MSRLSRIPEPFLILSQAIQSAGFRLPVLVEGSADWCYECVTGCLEQLQYVQNDSPIHSPSRSPTHSPVLWFSKRAPENAWQLPENRIHHELGREAAHLVFDGFSGFNADALAAMTGALKQGGCLFLMIPPLDKLADFDDPYYDALAVVPRTAAQVSHHYLARLAGMLGASRQLVRIRQDEKFIYPDQLPVPKSAGSSAPRKAATESGPESDYDAGVTADQRAAVQAVLGAMTGHRNRPLVLLADRGRGKSAAIGLALKTLHGKSKSIAVTAPRPESVETLMRFADQTQSTYVHFYAPDFLLDSLPQADLLIIDEAAAIAPTLLVRMLKHYSRVVMATTVRGYEGTGRGFDIRFRQLLDRDFPGWKSLILEQPIRWQPGDWLEELINSALMPSGNAVSTETDFRSIGFSELNFGSLSEPDLADVFELLTNAHYRTRPADLRTLMDGVNVRTFVLKAENQLVAIAMIAEEGELPEDLSHQILQGQRRPKGQILPQTMAVHLGQESALQMRFWRVIRIAVQPCWQSQGFGSQMLASVRAQAEAEQVDALGSVFSATSTLLSFWQRNELQLLRMGYTRESTTGGYSALVMQSITAKACAIQNRAAIRFSEDLPQSLTDTHRALPVDLVLKMIVMAAQQYAVELPDLVRDERFLADYLAGFKVYENGSASVSRRVWRWLWRCPEVLKNLEMLAPSLDMVILKIVQNRSWTETVEIMGLTGLKQARKQLQDALSQLTTLNNESESQ